MKHHLIYLGVIVLLVVIVGFNRCSNDTTTSVETETSTEIDSTVVDSLTSRIQYLESLPPDTIRVKPEVDSVKQTEDTTDTGKKIKEYNSSYSDSLITARWSIRIAGTLVDQDFEYIPRATPVVRETKYKYQTRYLTTTNTTTITKQTGGFLAVGGSVGASPTGLLYEVQLRYQAKDGYSYHAQYTQLPTGHNAVMVGLTIPIRLRSIF